MKEGYVQAGVDGLPGGGQHGEAFSLTVTLDSVLAAARRGWSRARANVLASSSPSDERSDTERLREAFRVFTEGAARLEGAYGVLRARVERLSAELVRANGELERQLREKQVMAERQSALLAALPAGVVVIDASGLVSDANVAAERLLGARLVGLPWQEVAARLQPADSEFEWFTPGDATRRVSLETQETVGCGGRIALLHDVTDAHAARLRVERTERLASMGEMAARFAHQLRTPLATAMLYAGQLERADLGSTERVRLSERIMSRLRSLERVTREMLRFVRGEQVSDQPIEVDGLLLEVAEVMAPLMAARGISFVCEDASGGSLLRGDRRGLAAALLSLLENAAQATEQGGKVRVEAMASRKSVRIRVSDSGRGIPKQALARLFEPFYSTRADGTGLGLAIVKSVAEAHGGSIAVETTDAVGACFTLSLPRAQGAPASANPTAGRLADSASALAAARVEREAA